jgi:outer membrane protein OmpA-like peptidoglycan-associated protein
MKCTILCLSAVFLFSPHASAQQAAPLDEAVARAGLSIKPPRNPVKSSSPIVKRTYERRAAKGLTVETGAAAAVAEVDVEVIHRADGSTEEHPFVPLPILFVVNSDQLFDDTSRVNAAKMAGILTELIGKEKAVFAIQGHTSAEGDAAANQQLSERRADRLLAMLSGQGVAAARLTAQGLGEDCARFPDTASESQLQQDRRVLIVRMK